MKAKMHRFSNNVKLIMLYRCETWEAATQITNKPTNVFQFDF